MTAVAEAARMPVAPMTRAQKFQWHLERGIADGVRRLPDNYDSALILELVKSLQREYEILRTSIDIVDGDSRQRVHESGEPMTIVDVTPNSDVAARVATLAEEFVASTVRHVGKILVKFYLLRQGAALWLAIIADNTAIDRACYEMLDDKVMKMLGDARETTPGPRDVRPVLQPAQLALREESTDGRAERQKAREYLRRHYSTAPPRPYPRSSAGAAGRYYRCSLNIAQADRVFAHIIDATGRLPSAVILSAFAYLMCWRADVTLCAVNVSMENRYTRELRAAFCATSQRAPVSLRMPGDTLCGVVAAVQSALSDGYPIAGRYDPSDLAEERAAAEAGRGLCLTPDLAFNFNPPLQGWTALLEEAPADGVLPEAGEGDVVIKSTNETSYEYGASLSVRWRDKGTACLSIHGDSQALEGDDCAAVLRGIEIGLRKFAPGLEPVDMPEVAESVGLTRAERHSREVRSGDIWYDLLEIESCLLKIDGVEKIDFFLDPRSGGALTVRATVTDHATIHPSDLRTALLERVRTGTLAAIPHSYQLARG
jgi:hypothetical protein